MRHSDWLDRFGIISCGFSLDQKGKPEIDPAYHASGHAAWEELAWVIDRFDPEVIIPVRTMRREWFEENFSGVGESGARRSKVHQITGIGGTC